MNDYLSCLAARSLSINEAVRPRLPSIFEPLHPPSEGPLFGYSPILSAGYAGINRVENEHREIDLPVEPLTRREGMPRRHIEYEGELEGCIPEKTPGLKAGHIEFVPNYGENREIKNMVAERRDGEQKENNLSEELLIHRGAAPRRHIEYEGELEGSIHEKPPDLKAGHIEFEPKYAERWDSKHTVIEHKDREQKENELEKRAERSESRTEKPVPAKQSSLEYKKHLIKEKKKNSFEEDTNLVESENQETQIDPIPKNLEFVQKSILNGVGLRPESDTSPIVSEEIKDSSDPISFKLDQELQGMNRHHAKRTVEETFQPFPDHGKAGKDIGRFAHIADRLEKTSSDDPSIQLLASSRSLSLDPESRSIAGPAVKASRVSNQIERPRDPILASAPALARHRVPIVGPVTTKRIPDPEPTVNVTIGRIEVRAVQQVPSPRPSRQTPKAPSLDDYLRSRARGSVT